MATSDANFNVALLAMKVATKLVRKDVDKFGELTMATIFSQKSKKATFKEATVEYISALALNLGKHLKCLIEKMVET